MVENKFRLRHLVALFLFSATPLTTLAEGGSIRFQGRIVEPTCTIRAAVADDRHLHCNTEQRVQVRVTPVGKSGDSAALTLDGKPLRNARLVTHRLQAARNVTLATQRVPVSAGKAQGPAGNAVIVLFSYL